MSRNLLSILPPVLVVYVAFSFRNVESPTVPFKPLATSYLAFL